MERIQEEYSSYMLMEGESNSKGWKYCYWITDSVARNNTIQFILLAVLFELVLTGGSIYVAVRQARKLGTPLDHIFELISKDSEQENTTEKLGELVADMVSTNQEMLEEIEESRPQLRKAFFHDLLTMDVSGTAELSYLAESVGINIQSNEFWVISLRLFSNNDVYDVDEQTLKDVRVIMGNMQKHIEEYLEQDVWFTSEIICHYYYWWMEAVMSRY